MIFIPFVFFKFGQQLAELFSLDRDQLISVIVICGLLFEAMRLKIGFTIFGQRDYEAHQISAIAWGLLGIGLILIMAPHQAYVYPLVISLAIGDPLMGEMRRKGMSSKHVMVYSTLVLWGIWFVCSFLFGTPYWLSFLLAPLCMISEWPRLSYIDDNATMTLIPLSVILLFEPFIGLL